MTHFSSEFFGTATVDVSYTEDVFDDQDGVGPMRAAGPLWVLGMVFIGIALLAIQDLLLVRAAWMGWAAVGAAAVGPVLLVTGLVLLPIGIDQNLDFDRANDPDDTSGSVDWKAGLVLGSIAGGLAVAGLALAVVAAAPRWQAHADEAGFD